HQFVSTLKPFKGNLFGVVGNHHAFVRYARRPLLKHVPPGRTARGSINWQGGAFHGFGHGLEPDRAWESCRAKYCSVGGRVLWHVRPARRMRRISPTENAVEV